jgi:hypothetical protein
MVIVLPSIQWKMPREIHKLHDWLHLLDEIMESQKTNRMTTA